MKNNNCEKQIFYHGNCQDGFACAWLLKKKFNSATFSEYQPNDKIDFSKIRKNSEIIFADCCPTIEDLKTLLKINNVVIVDHHITNIDKINNFNYYDYPNLRCYLNVNECGATLVAKYYDINSILFPREIKILEFIKQRDLWKFEGHEDEKEDREGEFITLAIFSEEYDFDTWDTFNERYYELAEKGKLVEEINNRQIEFVLENVFIENIGGYNVPCVNSTWNWSILCNKMLEIYDSSPFVAAFYINSEGKKKYSLRSRKNFDCSEVAKIYGGGGHRQSAGFVV